MQLSKGIPFTLRPCWKCSISSAFFETFHPQKYKSKNRAIKLAARFPVWRRTMFVCINNWYGQHVTSTDRGQTCLFFIWIQFCLRVQDYETPAASMELAQWVSSFRTYQGIGCFDCSIEGIRPKAAAVAHRWAVSRFICITEACLEHSLQYQSMWQCIVRFKHVCCVHISTYPLQVWVFEHQTKN